VGETTNPRSDGVCRGLCAGAACRNRTDDLFIGDQIKQHGTALDTKTVVEQWATQWLENVGKPNTLLSYESITRNWIVPTIGAKKVAFL